MYLCQYLEQNTDRRYRADWRVVTYKLVAVPGAKSVTRAFMWERYSESRWWGPRRFGLYLIVIETAEQRCRKHDLRSDIPEFTNVHHGQVLTARQAVKLTGVQNPMCFDFLSERDLNDPQVVPLPPKPTKPKPSKLELVRRKQQKAESRIEQIDRQIARLEDLRKKWARRQKYHAGRADSMSVAETESTNS